MRKTGKVDVLGTAVRASGRFNRTAATRALPAVSNEKALAVGLAAIKATNSYGNKKAAYAPLLEALVDRNKVVLAAVRQGFDPVAKNAGF